jgi:hypothetical protein
MKKRKFYLKNKVDFLFLGGKSTEARAFPYTNLKLKIQEN